MLPKKETEKIEFKKSISELKESVISITSMLNKSNCGVVYFGIKNDGTIVGQEIGEYTTTKIVNEIKNHIKPIIHPKIEVISYNDKKVIMVEVSGKETPYSAYGRYYIRCDDQDSLMTNNELEKFFLDKNFSYSEWENEITKYSINDIDENLLIEYIDKANEVNRMNYRYKDIEDALIKLDLLVNGHLNNAGVYLFSNKKILMLKLAIFATDSRLTFIDNKQFFGNIFECINEGIKYISNNIYYHAEIIGTTRVETPEIPIEAIREIVVNSFVHMKVIPGDYNEIIITPTRVRIYNPGTIVMGKSPKDFAEGKIGSKIRNPLIALTLYKNKTIEAFGTGFKRVFELCDKNNIKYDYGTDGFGFYFEFYRNKVSFYTLNDSSNESFNYSFNDSLDYSLTELENKIIEYLKQNYSINSVKDISTYLNKSEATLKRSLAKLIEKNIIMRVGSKKTGYWKLKN